MAPKKLTGNARETVSMALESSMTSALKRGVSTKTIYEVAQSVIYPERSSTSHRHTSAKEVSPAVRALREAIRRSVLLDPKGGVFFESALKFAHPDAQARLRPASSDGGKLASSSTFSAEHQALLGRIGRMFPTPSARGKPRLAHTAAPSRARGGHKAARGRAQRPARAASRSELSQSELAAAQVLEDMRACG